MEIMVDELVEVIEEIDLIVFEGAGERKRLKIQKKKEEKIKRKKEEKAKRKEEKKLGKGQTKFEDYRGWGQEMNKKG